MPCVSFHFSSFAFGWFLLFTPTFSTLHPWVPVRLVSFPTRSASMLPLHIIFQTPLLLLQSCYSSMASILNKYSSLFVGPFMARPLRNLLRSEAKSATLLLRYSQTDKTIQMKLIALCPGGLQSILPALRSDTLQENEAVSLASALTCEPSLAHYSSPSLL